MKKVLYGLFSMPTFRNNYLAVTIGAVLLTLSMCASAQRSPYDSTRGPQASYANGFEWGTGIFKHGLVPPNDTLKLRFRDSGAIAYKGGKQWLYNGRYWSQFSGTGGSSTPDTVYAKWPISIDDTKTLQVSESYFDSLYGRLNQVINVSLLELEADTLLIGFTTYKYGGIRDTASPVNFVIDTALPFIHRIDAVVVNAPSNLIDTLKGVPDSFNAIPRIIPDTCLLVAYVNVFGSSIMVNESMPGAIDSSALHTVSASPDSSSLIFSAPNGTTYRVHLLAGSGGSSGSSSDSAYVNVQVGNDSTLVFIRKNLTLKKDSILIRPVVQFSPTTPGIVPPSGTDTSTFLNQSGSWIQAWKPSGNQGTAGGFIGTTDNAPLHFRMRNLLSGIIDSASGGLTGRVGFGYRVFGDSYTSTDAIGIGVKTLSGLTSGVRNIGIGHRALLATTTSSGNIGIGTLAGSSLTSSNASVIIGDNAAPSITGGNTVAIGLNVLGNATGTGANNTAIGSRALENSTSISNTVIGALAMRTGVNTGGGNVAIGLSSGDSYTAAGGIFIGGYAGKYATSGNYQFYVNSIDRTDALGDQTKSLIYGVGAASPTSQTLSINARVGINMIAPTAHLHLPRSLPGASGAAIKFSPAVAITTTGASGTGSVATLTFSSTPIPAFVPGSSVTVAGVTPSGYNGTYVVTSVTATSISYTNSTTGSQTVAGTISQGAKLATKEIGAVEYVSDLYVTNSDNVRFKLTGGQTVFTATGNITEEDLVSLVDNGGTNVTLTLPAASSVKGLVFTIARFNSTSTGSVTINAVSGNVMSLGLVSGASMTLAAAGSYGQAARFQSNGTNYHLIN